MRNLTYRTTYFTVLVVGLLISACSVQESTIKNTGFSAVYELVSVDGKPVPTSISHGGPSIQIRSGLFTFHADGTCSSLIVMVPPSGSEVKREVSATYTLEDSTLSMKWKGAGRTEGTIEGNTFTMVNEGIKFVYRK